MTDGLEIRIRIAEDELRREAEAAGQAVRKGIGSQPVPIEIDTGTAAAEIQSLGAQLLSAKSALSDDANVSNELKRQANLLQESLRYKQQLAAIDDAGLSEEDATNAKRLADELNRVNVDRIEKDFNKLQDAAKTAFNSAEDELQGLQVQLLSAQSSLSSGGDAAGLQRQANLLQESLRFKRQLAAIDDAGFSPADAANAKRLAAEINKVNVNRIEKDFKNLKQSAETSLGGVRSLVGSLLQGIGQGIGQQLTQSFQQAISGLGQALKGAVADFVLLDDAIKQVGVISGSTGTAGLGELREEVERLGLVTSKTPDDIGRTAVAFSRAGFTVQETSAALEGIARASEATGESLETVGDIVAKTTRAFGLSAADAEFTADLFVTTANNTNTTVNGLGDSLSYVAAQAAASNQPLDDTLVLLGLLGDAGIQGSSAGTGLAAALDRLKIASAGGETEFSNLVRGSARASEAFDVIGATVRGTDGQMRSLLDVLPEIQENIEGLSQQDQDVLFKALFGVEGGRTIQTLLNTTGERINFVSGAIDDAAGASRRGGEALLQGLGGALDLVGGSAALFSAKIGESIAPALDGIVRTIVEVLNSTIQSVDFDGFAARAAGIGEALLGNEELLASLGEGLKIITEVSLDSLLDGFQFFTELLARNPDILIQIGNGLQEVANVSKIVFAQLQGVGEIIEAFGDSAIGNTLKVAADGLRNIRALSLRSEFEDAAEGIEFLEGQSDGLTQQLSSLKLEMMGLEDAIAAGTATDEQIERYASLQRSYESLLPAIDEQIAAFRDVSAIYPEQRGQIDANIASLERLRGALTATAEEALTAGNALGGAFTPRSTAIAPGTLGEETEAAVEDEEEDRLAALRERLQLEERERNNAAAAEVIQIRQLQAARALSEEEAAQQIQEVRSRGLAAELVATEAQLAEIEAMRAEGLLTDEEAVEARIAAEGEIGSIRLQQVEAQIDAQEELRDAELDRLEEVAEQERIIAEERSAALDEQLQGLQQEQSLLTARGTLQQAEAELANQQLQQRIQAAELAGNTQLAEQLQSQLLEQQSVQLAEQQEIEREQLRLSQEQAAIELQRQSVLVAIASTEAEIAIQQAEANDASAAELENLQRVLDLRQQQEQFVNEQASTQQELNALAEQELAIRQQIAQEAQSAARAADAAASSSSGGGTSGGSSSGGSGGGGGTGGLLGREVSLYQEAVRELDTLLKSGADLERLKAFAEGGGDAQATDIRQRALAGSAAAGVLEFVQPVDQSDIARVVGTETARSNAALNETLQGLNRQIAQLGNSPRSVTVQSANPLGEVGNVISQLQQAESRAFGL